MLKIKLLSDVHLERYSYYPGVHKFFRANERPDIICLCGDICVSSHKYYEQFLRDCADYCKIMTFVIPGNHEFYHTSIECAKAKIAYICDAHDRLTFLNNSTYVIGKITFLGTTLWSDIDSCHAWQIRNMISDFKCIKNWSIGVAKDAYHTNLAWLRGKLDTIDTGQTVIVMTHHVPLTTVGNPKYHDSAIKSAFESDLSSFIELYTNRIAFWFYGHNHYSNSHTIGKTRVVSNQAGYIKDDSIMLDPRYDDNLTILLRSE